MKNSYLFILIFIFFGLSLKAQTIIHTADFETNLDGWTQDTGDNFDWTRDSGGTPSGNTGPTTGASGSYYMFTEASSNYNNTANFTSPSFNLSGITNPQFKFYYHMYGEVMGTLFVDISTDGGATYPTNLWSKTGQDQTSNGAAWTPINIDLSAYIGQTVYIRFRGITGSAYTSDMAIDNITLTVTYPSAPEINILGNGVSILDGDTSPSLSDYTDLGATDIAAPRTRTFSIQNLGALTLNLTGTPIVSITGNPAFTIQVQPSSTTILSGGSDLNFIVLFTPTVLGTVQAVISIDNNDSNENPYNFTIQASAEQNFFDSDGDGVFDNIDIDDDNDGILDEEEEISCRKSNVASTVNYKFLNETFGAGARTTINTTYPAETTYCFEDGTAGTNTDSCPSLSDWSLNDGEYTVGSSAQIASWAAAYWYMGGDHTGDTNGRMALFNASYDPGLFYSATIKGALPNVPVTYSFWVLNLDTSVAPGIATRLRPNILVEFRDVNNNLLASISTGDIAPTTNGNLAGDWYQFTANLTFNVDEFYVYFYNNETGGLGNDLALDDIVISQTLCDTDSDGVADIFDLDSDNDGIPDVVEYGLGNLSGGTAKLDPSLDTNGDGMADAAKAYSDSLLPNDIRIDADLDGIPNQMDLDSDNDGIFDVDESGAGNSGNATYQNGDGDINGDGVGDGLDTDAFRETDVDSDGTLEFFTDGILNIYDYYSGGNFSTSYGNINQGIGFTYFVIDTDSDGIPDYLDTMSNGTTFDIVSTLYASLDTNNDGVIDGITDTDGDGILDVFDTNDVAFGSPRDLNRKLLLYFDGRNDYGEDDTTVISGSEATIMGWIKIDPLATGDQILFGQNKFYLKLKSNKFIEAIANGNTISTASALSTNQWIHISATYNSSGTLKLYINGLEVATNTSAAGSLADASPFTIGRKPDTNTNYYRGHMDEVRVFDKALSVDELQKMIYQEIENNSGTVKGTVIPRNVTDYVNAATITPLPWANLKRCFRMDAYKDDVIDDFSTASIDVGTGARIYNMKIIDVQTAPLPFVTQIGDTTLDNAVNVPSSGVLGTDATTYDWSIVKIEHKNITYNANQKHLGLFVNSLDASLNPIEFSIQNDTELNISWYLKLDGFIDLEGESQLVQGDDSILDENSGGYIERDQQGTASSFNYNYWSSTVGQITAQGAATGNPSTNSSNSISGFLRDGTTVTNPQTITFSPAYNAADGAVTNPITISSYWLWKFHGTDDDYNSWVKISETSSLLPGEGYTMKGTSGFAAITTLQNYVYRGKPYNGDITLPLTIGFDRLIGNPYASAIDADEFIRDNISVGNGGSAATNTINGTLYFWDHFAGATHILSEYTGGYATYTLIGGANAISNDIRINNDFSAGTKTPERYIPVNQGFFVVADAGGDVVFKNSQRIFKKEGATADNSGSLFLKANNNEKSTQVNSGTKAKVKLQFDSPTGYHRQLLVGVDENASNNFDVGYDGALIESNLADMFWVIDEDKYVIQGVNNFNTEQELSLGLLIEQDGLATIKIDKTENLDTTIELYIKDSLTGESFNISENPFKINLEKGEYLNRFLLTFKSNSINVEEEVVSKNAIQVFMNNESSEIQIKKSMEAKISGVFLLNYLGQIVQEWNGNFNENTFALPIHMNPGLYLVQINTQEGKTTKKIVVN